MRKTRNLYFYLLVLPILFSLLSIPLIKILDGSLPDILSILLVMIAFSGIVGGIPYLVVAALIIFLTRRKPESYVRRALLLSPLGMVAVFPIFILVISFFPSMKMNLSGVGEFVKAWAFLSMYSIIFGYAYVAIIFGIVRLYRGSAYTELPA